MVFSSPFIFWFWQGRIAAGSPFYDIYHLNIWGSSLNSLPIPPLIHPWLDQVANRLYTGTVNEGSLANLGIAATLLVIASPFLLRGRRRRLAPIFLAAFIGLILAVGPFLKWNDELIELEAVRPVNALAWNIGHALKPQIFEDGKPIDQYQMAVPAPQLFLTAIIPFWEGARVSSRYALVGSVGFFLLAAAVIDRFRGRWWVFMLVGLLMFEAVPRPFYRYSVPVVNEVHPAYTWLSQQNLNTESVSDDLFWRFGWGGLETWGTYGTDNGSLLEWVATNKRVHKLQVTAFPHCVTGQTQSLIVKANGRVLGSYDWRECEDWQAEFLIPGDIIDVGWNNLTFEYGFGLAPAELAGSDNPDGRE